MMWQQAEGQHTEYTMLMSLVLDEEATAAEAAQLRSHLAGCPLCAQTWQRWQELDRRLGVAAVVPAPVDFSAAVLSRLDGRVAEHSRRRWFMIWLAVSWLAAMFVALAALGVANGWRLQFLSDNGPASAALTGLASMGGWVLRLVVAFVERTGTPTVAAGAGALLCVTCLLATAWLAMVARLTPVTGRTLARSFVAE